MSTQKIREARGRLYEDPLREVSVLQYLSREEHVNVLQCTEVMTPFEEHRRRMATFFAVYCTSDEIVLLWCLAVDCMKLCLLGGSIEHVDLTNMCRADESVEYVV